MRVKFHSRFQRDLDSIKDERILSKVEEIIIALENVSSLNEISQIKKIKGHSNAYRIRIRGYRIGFYYNKDEAVLKRILKRADIYKYFP